MKRRNGIGGTRALMGASSLTCSLSLLIFNELVIIIFLVIKLLVTLTRRVENKVTMDCYLS